MQAWKTSRATLAIVTVWLTLASSATAEQPRGEFPLKHKGLPGVWVPEARYRTLRKHEADVLKLRAALVDRRREVASLRRAVAAQTLSSSIAVTRIGLYRGAYIAEQSDHGICEDELKRCLAGGFWKSPGLWALAGAAAGGIGCGLSR